MKKPAKRKKKPATPKDRTTQNDLDDIAYLAESMNLIDGFLDDELWDACESDARLTHENVKGQAVREQLEFLYERGYALGRLKELIEEAEL